MQVKRFELVLQLLISPGFVVSMVASCWLLADSKQQITNNKRQKSLLVGRIKTNGNYSSRITARHIGF
jgi:UPF0716 family protein affecting phage T7 exclusion